MSEFGKPPDFRAILGEALVERADGVHAQFRLRRRVGCTLVTAFTLLTRRTKSLE